MLLTLSLFICKIHVHCTTQFYFILSKIMYVGKCITNLVFDKYSFVYLAWMSIKLKIKLYENMND